jgi:hypothetical protein
MYNQNVGRIVHCSGDKFLMENVMRLQQINNVLSSLVTLAFIPFMMQALIG